MSKALFVLLILTIAAYTQCPANNQLSGLVSDFVGFNPTPSSQNNITSSLFQYSFKKSLNSTPNVGFGIWDMNVIAGANNPLNEFGVTVNLVSVSSITFEFKYQPRVWKFLRIGFWACNRPQIFLGAGISNFGSLHSSIYTQKISFSTILNYQNPIARVFLNGFGVNAGTQGLQIQIQARDLTSNGFTLAAATGNKTNLKSILFSYIVFSPTTAPFASYGGSVSKTGFSGIGYQDISNTIYSANFILQGLIKLGTSLNFSLISSLDNNFVLGFSSQSGNIDFIYAYVVVGVSPQSLCSHCSNEKCAYGDICVAKCPDNTYQFTYKDGGRGCRSCSISLGLVYSKQTQSCVCASGYQLINGICTIISGVDNAIRNTGATLTIINNNQIQGSSSTSTITQVYNSTTSGGFTVINPPSNTNPTQSYVPSVPTPTYTTPATISSSTTSTSITIAGIATSTSLNTAQTAQICSNFANTYWTGYRCSCRVGYMMDTTTGLCVKIGFTGVDPIIVPGYYPPINNCSQYEEWNNGQCVCQPNCYRNNDGRCVIYEDCPDNSYRHGNECVCMSGYIKKKGNCIFDCPDNSYPQGNYCICEQGYTMINGQCVRNQNPVCGVNQQYNYTTKRCECKPGYILINNVCTFGTCPNNQVLDPQTYTCKCTNGMAMDNNGICYYCPINEIVVNGICNCKNGFTRNPTTGVCQPNCMPPNAIINGACGYCVSPSIYNAQSQTCVCPTGYVMDNRGVCQPTTTCNPGYYQGPTGCLPCGSGCATCTSAIVCLTCQDPTLTPNSNGVCIKPTTCGNRIVQTGQQCDDGNTFNGDGCSNTCTIQNGFQCSGNPSVCIPNSLTGINVIVTTNTVIVTLMTSQIFTFTSYQTMSSFILYTFTVATRPTSGFCTQRPTNLYIFDCYFTYTNNVPSNSFVINFSYNYNGATGSTNVAVTPNNQPNNPCGNRVLNVGETCDDGNIFSSDGCSSNCIIQNGWTCTSPTINTPSVCTPQQPAPSMTTTNIFLTTTTITVTLRVSQTFIFTNQQDMSSFIQYVFGSGYQPTSGFCLQRSWSLLFFDCYFTYASGIPQTTFVIYFSFSRNGVTGATSALVNPTNSLCGNRLPNQFQGCDDGNNINGDGCSSTCQIQTGWTCTPATNSGPSVCTQQPTSGLFATNVTKTTTTIVVTLMTSSTFTFANQQEMLSFIQYQFQTGFQPTSGFCVQKNNDLKTFDCTFSYLNGIPQSAFTILFYYNRNGQTASVTVPITSQGTGMSYVNVILNINAVYVTLRVDTIFTFANEQEMTSFMQYQIPSNSQPSSGFCRQRPSDLRLFDCLYNYPSGVPRNSYSINFSYSKNGINGNLSVFVDVTKSQINTRSLH